MPSMLYVLLGTIRKYSPASGEDVCKTLTFSDDSTHIFVHLNFLLLLLLWVIGSMLHGGPTELFLVPVSASRLVKQRRCHVLSCLWDDAYIRSIATNWKELPMWQQRVFPRYLSGPLPYVRRHITVNKMCFARH